MRWRWVGAAGPAELIGPVVKPGHTAVLVGGASQQIDADGVRQLLRAVFVGAGGTHDDWDEYDRAMASEGRLAVLVRPERLTGNTDV